jgi:ribokinase
MSSKPRIAVIGSANIDMVTYTDDIPRPGETIFGREFHLGFGGKGANQAAAAKCCGADVAMVARVGDDLFGPATVQNFAAMGIDTTHVQQTAGVSSGVAPIFVDSKGQNRIWVIKGANDRLSPADIEAAAETLKQADFLVMQLEVPLETVYYALQFGRQHGIRTILNPAPAMALDLKLAGVADYVIPNETEAEVIGGLPVRDLDEAKACAAKLLSAGVRRTIITLGSNGALVAGQEGMVHVPAFAVTPVDTTGAGDAFIGSLACFLAEGLQELEAVKRANLYAAMSTLSPGTMKSFLKRTEFEAEAQRRGFPAD